MEIDGTMIKINSVLNISPTHLANKMRLIS